ncbi:MAG: cyclic nucleotide-binding domain-containing protein [Myxococcota bacterium]|nr:cyclic nucleotide-binding domain-containing protein [Myxococcota bacterium]
MVELTGFGEFEGVELLQRLPIFSKLSFDETSRLAAIIVRTEVGEGTIVIEQNALGDALYVIQEGEARVTRDLDLDGRHDSAEEIGRLGPGDLFGEMSLVDDLLTSARVTAMGPLRLLKMPKQGFTQLLATDDRFAAKVYQSFCRTLSDRLRRANELLSGNKVHSVQVR